MGKSKRLVDEWSNMTLDDLNNRNGYVSDPLLDHPDRSGQPEGQVSVFASPGGRTPIVNHSDGTAHVADLYESTERERTVRNAEAIGIKAFAACRQAPGQLVPVETRTFRISILDDKHTHKQHG